VASDLSAAAILKHTDVNGIAERGHNFPLELGERRKYIEHEVVPCGLAKFRRGNNHQPDALLAKFFQQDGGLEQATDKPVQSMDDDDIDRASSRVRGVA
jgi:hypothetical protein